MTHILGLAILCASFSAWSDELVLRREQLLALDNTADQLSKEIRDLERLSAERARNIKNLKAKIQEARHRVEQRQDQLEKIKAKADEVEKAEAAQNSELASIEAKLKDVNAQLAKVNEDYSKADARHKAKLSRIEKDKQEELKRRTELTRRVANFEEYVRRQTGQRDQAEADVQTLSRGNERLYDKLKGPQPASVAPVPEVSYGGD